MNRNPPILFTPVGWTKTGRRLYKLCHRGGQAFGRAFCITSERLRLSRAEGA